MRPKYALVALLFLLPSFCGAMARYQGDCTKGGQTVTLGGVAAPQFVMRSFVNSSLGVPTSGCTVTVYPTGSLTPATIYSDSIGTALGNPFTADVNGHFFFYAADFNYDIQLSGAGFGAPYTLGAVPVMDPIWIQAGSSTVNRTYLAKVREVYSMEDFSGTDCGAQINNAYSQLPATGGTILVHTSCSFTTPIVFGTNNKPVVVQGFGQGLTLTFTPTSGAALTANNGTSYQSRWDNITLLGPGNAISTAIGNTAVGLLYGGANGANMAVSHARIGTFGVDIKLAANGNNLKLQDTKVFDSQRLFYYPTGVSSAGMGLNWTGAVFDGLTNSAGQNIYFEGPAGAMTCDGCTFSNFNLWIGTAGSGWADINLTNSKLIMSPGANTSLITMLFNASNNLNAVNTSWYNNDPSFSLTYFNSISGGTTHFVNCTLKSLTTGITSFNLLGFNAALTMVGFNDTDGALVALNQGSTTGWITNLNATSPQGPTYFNNFIRLGSDTITGNNFMDLGGTVRTTGQFVSTVATGTVPIAVTSTDKVTVLHTNMDVFNGGGGNSVGSSARVTSDNHVLIGQVTMPGGGSYTINLTGTAVFLGGTTYTCNVTSDAIASQGAVTYGSGTQFTILGTSAHVYRYTCIGN